MYHCLRKFIPGTEQKTFKIFFSKTHLKRSLLFPIIFGWTFWDCFNCHCNGNQRRRRWWCQKPPFLVEETKDVPTLAGTMFLKFLKNGPFPASFVSFFSFLNGYPVTFWMFIKLPVTGFKTCVRSNCTVPPQQHTFKNCLFTQLWRITRFLGI